MVGGILENRLQSVFQICDAHSLLADPDSSVCRDRQQDVITWRRSSLVRWLWHERIQAVGKRRRSDHENDEQDEQNVDQRRDVQFCFRTTSSDQHRHSRVLLVPWTLYVERKFPLGSWAA